MNLKIFVLFLFIMAHEALCAYGLDSCHILIKGNSPSGYITQIDEYIAENDYESALSACDTVIKYCPGLSDVYFRRAKVYSAQHRFEEKVSDAEKAIQLDSNSLAAMEVYFWGAHEIGRTDAVDIYQRVKARDPHYANLESLRLTSKQWNNLWLWSHLGVGTMLVSLIFFFLFFYYRQIIAHGDRSHYPRPLSFPFILLIPVFATSVLYYLFFHFSPVIHSGNTHYPALEYNPYSIRSCTFEHDGMEGFVLYGLFFAVILLSICLMLAWERGSARARSILFFLLAFATIFFFCQVGFYAPFQAAEYVMPRVIVHTILFLGVVYLFNAVLLCYHRVAVWAVALLLLPVFFLMSDWFSVYDYGYVLSPALRLLQGDHIQDIYFQYDLFLSLLGLAWMKLHIDLGYIYILAEASYYLLFLGLFIFSRKLFNNKRLPFFLLVFGTMLRYYANMSPTGMFQITPWRLDLWLVLLWLVYARGAYDWLTACFLGLMIVFHRNFGFIYLASYMQLWLVLWVADMVREGEISKLGSVVIRHLKLCAVNIGIIMLAFGCSYLVLGGLTPDSALAYRKIGIGMMPIANDSFYWYLPVVLGAITLMLIRDHRRFSQRYITTGIFLVLLTVGNSLYFFGRSHEHNIINLSALLSLCLFFFIDMLYGRLPGTGNISTAGIWKVRVYRSLPLIFISTACLFYYRALHSKLDAQMTTLMDWKCKKHIPFQYDFQSLKELTDSSPKVFFLEFEDDFMYYYCGQYRQSSYFTPNDAWVLKKDMAAMLQLRLDSGYYIAPITDEFADEFLQMLDYNAYASKGETRVVYKRPAPHLIDTSRTVFYRSFVSRLPGRGVQVSALYPGTHFTIECLIRPDSAQKKNASIFADLNHNPGDRGLSLYCSDSFRHEYTFRYGNDKGLQASAPFILDPGRRYYVAICAGDSLISIYVDGLLKTTLPYDGDYLSSGKTMVIGNDRSGNSPFAGWIYEMNISKASREAAKVSQNQERIANHLQ